MLQLNRVLELQEEYKFKTLENKKEELKARGKEVIDLSIGTPDLPVPAELLNYFLEYAKIPQYSRYSPYEGVRNLRIEIAKYMQRRFGVVLNPEEEILILIGSKEGIYHLPFVVLNENELAVIFDPAYPVYKNSIILRNAKYMTYCLCEENNFQPTIDFETFKKAKLIYLNTPNNPIGICLNEAFLKELIAFAKKTNAIVVNDNAYCEIVFDRKPISILQFDKEKTNVVEFHSFSKSLSISGWRIGWVCGNKNIIKNMLKLKTYVDSGVFPAIQEAIAKIMPTFEQITEKTRKIYQYRSQLVYNSLCKKFKTIKPDGTFYLWFKTPLDADLYVEKLLNEKGILLSPATCFSENIKNWARISLTVEEQTLRKFLQLI